MIIPATRRRLNVLRSRADILWTKDDYIADSIDFYVGRELVLMRPDAAAWAVKAIVVSIYR